MANEGTGSGTGTGEGSAAEGNGAAAGASATEGKSILDGAVAPGKEGEPTKKADDAAGKAAEGKTEAGKTGTEGKEGAPEKYETFKTPEGITLEAKALEGFQAVAKELNLSQASAQKLVDFQTSQIKAAQDANLKSFEDMQKEWAAETRKALGNDADKQLGYAAAFRDKFLTEEARKVLRDSGLDNHPDIIKSLIAAGKAMSEDTFVEGKGDKGGKGEGKSAAQIIYPNQK
jgi:hypothetical protein